MTIIKMASKTISQPTPNNQIGSSFPWNADKVQVAKLQTQIAMRINGQICQTTIQKRDNVEPRINSKSDCNLVGPKIRLCY